MPTFEEAVECGLETKESMEAKLNYVLGLPAGDGVSFRTCLYHGTFYGENGNCPSCTQQYKTNQGENYERLNLVTGLFWSFQHRPHSQCNRHYWLVHKKSAITPVFSLGLNLTNPHFWLRR